MILFEGYKKAVEIYNKYSGTDNGRKEVTRYNNELGVSKEYLVWFTSCIVCYNIPLYIVLNAYKDWKRYVVSYYRKTGQPIPNIESLNYQQTMKIINECKRQWAKPNPIYNQNGVYVGEFKSFSDANMLPINTNWCITKTKSRYNEFNNENSKCLYIINNRNQDPWRRVIAVVYTDRVEYWDSTNIRMDDNASYENTLPSEVVDIIHSKCQKTNENKQHKTRYNMKKTIRLSESDLHRVINESVKMELESSYNTYYSLNDLEDVIPIKFEPFRAEFDASDVDECNYYLSELTDINPNVDIYIDEDNGTMSYYIRNGKYMGNPCDVLFGAGNDKKYFPYLWTTNNYKTAHALDAEGNISSVEFVANDGYHEDEMLGLGADGNVYSLAYWANSEVARKFLTTPLCRKEDLIGRYLTNVLFRASNNRIGCLRAGHGMEITYFDENRIPAIL